MSDYSLSRHSQQCDLVSLRYLSQADVNYTFKLTTTGLFQLIKSIAMEYVILKT